MGALYLSAGGRRLVARVWKATNAWDRLRGLLGRPPLAADEALLMEPCRLIHTFGMRYPLDLAFIDRRGRVCKIARDVKPARFAGAAAAHATLELPAGALAASGLKVGDAIIWGQLSNENT